jgi:hypothetical protein
MDANPTSNPSDARLRAVHIARGSQSGGVVVPTRGRRFRWGDVGLRPGALMALALATVAMSIAAGLVAVAHAEPASNDGQPGPYPDLRYFTEIDAAPYAVGGPPAADFPDQPGVWFVTAQGLNCGIWFRGSFGCVGDIPGAPAGVNKIGWITGDARVHYDWTMAVRFPPSRGTLSIPPLTFIESEGTKCATTFDGSTYCERGPWRLLITATHTLLNG